jgi:hypothetical protein
MDQYPNPYGSPPQGYQADPYGRPDIGYTPPGYSPPPMLPRARAPRRRRGGVGVLVAIVALVALVGIGGVVHANAATGTVKGYYDALFSYNFDTAFAQICPDTQAAAKADFDTTKQTLGVLKGYATFDTTKLTYALKSGGTTTAKVTVTGNIILSGSLLGITPSQPIPVSSNGDSTNVSLKANGLGWCIDVLPDSGTLPNS